MTPGTEGTPARAASHDTTRAGHTCAVCGQPLTRDLWDMTVWATESSVAYLPCLFAAGNP